MVGTDHGRPAPLESFAPEPPHGGRPSQKSLGRAQPQRTDRLGADGLDLSKQERGALGDLVGFGCSVLGGTAFDHVAYVDVFPPQPNGLDHLVEKLSGPSHEGPPQPVFIESGTFAHKKEPSFRGPFAKDQIRPGRVESASAAVSQLLADLGQIRGPIPLHHPIHRLLQRLLLWGRSTFLSVELLDPAPLEAGEQPPQLPQGGLQSDRVVQCVLHHVRGIDSVGLCFP